VKHWGEVLKKVATDVALGRTIVFPVTQAQEIRVLRISPVGVVHDLTFGGQVTLREKSGAGIRKRLRSRKLGLSTPTQTGLRLRCLGSLE